ncbi:homoserine dehydrogenase [Magnetospirillum sulfuroxidans]|uniref:Homoserine dehydrogenase n=1 Tax=Magnetospirillum sulfuroxidans TaxID=611300 RepID=A0ABS5I9U5_9PROT|nr:homoserine dehydrogenase [Magnetospirillum sulfuroxidans]MBR9971180.1 homoserine dehydrogenase [Magnetospirillum sulfuroxidans]
MMKPLKIALAGLGTVGAGLVKLLTDNAGIITARAGRPLQVVAVSARDRNRDRGIVLGAEVAWYDDAVKMAEQAECDVIVEVIGGSEGIARHVVETALGRGLHVVTANKALLAHHGVALAATAEDKGVVLGFEAAVAGGIPIIKALKEGLAGNAISRVTGILNGTCNYILTTMRETGRDFADVLAEAQALGYAEADPSFDIDGVDAAHKLAILTSLAFATPVDFQSMHVEGIRHVSAVDIDFADKLGYRIKLLGIAQATDHGIEQRVHACMVPVAAPIATVDGVFNAVVAEGDFVGRSIYEGRGAGAGPTASAVAADIIDIARGNRSPAFGVPVAALVARPAASMERRQGAYYMRLMVLDRPGVLADVATALRAEGVSVEQMIQPGRAPGETVPMVMTLHDTVEADMNRAVARIAALDAVVEKPRLIRIEPL